MNHPRRVAAFFDIDGTVLAGPSLEMRFAWWLMAQGEVGCPRLTAWAAEAAMGFVRGDRRAFRVNKKYLAGLPEPVVAVWSESLSQRLAVFAQAAARIEWHASQGHYVCFVSGTLEPLARMLAQRFAESVEVKATRLEVVEGIWTGFVQGNQISGAEKVRIVGEIARREGLSLERSFAYGNHPDDVPMLESVGNPIAVNPKFRLLKIAASRHWRVERWAISPAASAPSIPATPAVSSEEAH